MDTNALIDNLCNKEESPKQSPHKPTMSVVLGLASVALYIGACLVAMGVRDDIVSKLTSLPFQLEMAFAAITVFFAILAASWQAFPDLAERRIVAWFSVFPFLAFLASFGLGFALQSGNPPDFSYCISCAMHMCMIALIPTSILYYVLARGVFLHAKRTATNVGLASAMTAYLAVRLVEKTDDMMHLLFGHLLPIFALVCVMALIHWWLIRKKSV